MDIERGHQILDAWEVMDEQEKSFSLRSLVFEAVLTACAVGFVNGVLYAGGYEIAGDVASIVLVSVLIFGYGYRALRYAAAYRKTL